jgi:hypothetical protein
MKSRSPLVTVGIPVLIALALALGYRHQLVDWWQVKRADRSIERSKLADQLRDGDIIFQTSRSAQSKAIQLATHSPYSHCGLVFRDSTGGGAWRVLEAVQPVKWTPLPEWVARGEGGRFVVKRFVGESTWPDSVPLAIEAVGSSFLGKNYDLQFGWGDDRIYCSELVWKAYERAAGIELAGLQRLRDLDLGNPAVKTKLFERYGDQLPQDEPVISPGAIFGSDALVTVAQGE